MDPIKAAKFLKVARELASTMSKDKDKQVGCLILDPNTLFIRATGYNGFPLNIHDSDKRWERENKYTYVQHAEISAICSTARHGTHLNNSICSHLSSVFNMCQGTDSGWL